MCWIFSRLLTYLCEFAWATGSLFICHFIKHMEIDYAHIIGSSNHYPCFSVTWPTHYPGGQNIMDNSRQSAVLQDSVGKCCFFFHLSWAKTTWIIHQWRKKKIGGKICDPYFAQAARWHLRISCTESLTLHWCQDERFKSTNSYMYFQSGWVNNATVWKLKNKK